MYSRNEGLFLFLINIPLTNKEKYGNITSIKGSSCRIYSVQSLRHPGFFARAVDFRARLLWFIRHNCACCFLFSEKNLI